MKTIFNFVFPSTPAYRRKLLMAIMLHQGIVYLSEIISMSTELLLVYVIDLMSQIVFD